MTHNTRKLDIAFFQSEDTLSIARDLLGMVLCVRKGELLYSGIIVETEAYCGVTDKACHAFGGRRTSRTETMYLTGGCCYVYLCYGIHHLLNFVTHKKDHPHAVLIRGIEPVDGIVEMMDNRKLKRLDYRLSSGPGKLTKAMDIAMSDNGCVLNGNRIWVEDRFGPLTNGQISTSPRIGVNYAEEYASYPWRFYIKGNNWVSKLR